MSTHPRRGEVFNRDACAAWRLFALGGAVCGVLSAPPLTLVGFTIAAPAGFVIGTVIGVPIAVVLAVTLQMADRARCGVHQLQAWLAAIGALLAVTTTVALQSSLGNGNGIDGWSLLAGDVITLAVGARCGVSLARSHVRAWGAE